MTPINQAKALYGALKRAGYSKAYVHRMLPEWWDDGLLNDSSARVELDLMLARMFGFKLDGLLKEVPEVSFVIPEGAKYKRSRKIDTQELGGATSLVHSIAKMVSTAVPVPITPLPENPFEIRSDILARQANRVSLMWLVGYLWERGIPTIHLKELPAGLKKMDGMCLKVDERPVIILCKQSSFQAWNLFIVAHELGHIAMNHIATNEVLVDYTVGENSYLMADEDPEEKSADNFALGLLNGEYDVRYTSTALANAAQLADAAMTYQGANQVDAGHVILNYGHYNRAWPIAQAALKLIDQGDAPGLINEFLFDHLDLHRLPKTSVEFLLKVSGFGPPEREEDLS